MMYCPEHKSVPLSLFLPWKFPFFLEKKSLYFKIIPPTFCKQFISPEKKRFFSWWWKFIVSYTIVNSFVTLLFIVSGRELVILEYTHYHYIHNVWQVIPFSGMWVNNSFTYRKNYLQTYKATYILLYVSISILGGMLSRNLM